VGTKRERIHLSGTDAIDFLKSSLPSGKARRKVFVYLDPPYVNSGQRLYMNAYRPEDHSEIARYLSAQKVLPWLMPYDDAELIKQLYRQHRLFELPIRYSLQEKKAASELIISPLGMTSF
jgi:DNA adenine methylase